MTRPSIDKIKTYREDIDRLLERFPKDSRVTDGQRFGTVRHLVLAHDKADPVRETSSTESPVHLAVNWDGSAPNDWKAVDPDALRLVETIEDDCSTIVTIIRTPRSYSHAAKDVSMTLTDLATVVTNGGLPDPVYRLPDSNDETCVWMMNLTGMTAAQITALFFAIDVPPIAKRLPL